MDRYYTDDSSVDELNIFLDSGTTITPIFQFLLNLDVQKEKGRDFNIYTNNLAGIDEIHKVLSQIDCNINERDFNLIPGRPLNKYRATTGEETQKFLNAMWEEQKLGKQKFEKNIINLGILTANWFLLRKGLKRIGICARGSGHMAFKKNLINNCDFIFLLSPLGKLLPLEDVKDLNNLLPGKEDLYEYFEIPSNKCNQTILVTTYRSNNSLSPLLNFSIRLRDIKDAENYTLCDKNFEHDPGGDIAEIKSIEFPHKYVRINYRKIW